MGRRDKCALRRHDREDFARQSKGSTSGILRDEVQASGSHRFADFTPGGQI
jgi:hypothetical protein